MRAKYNLVDTEDKLKELDAVLMDGNTARYKYLAFDTETNGLDLYKSTVVGFSISPDSQTGYYIPLLRWVPNPESLKKRKFKKVEYQSYMEGQLKCVWTGQVFDEFVTPKEYNARERVPLIVGLLQRWLKSTGLIMFNAPFDVNMTYATFGVDLKDNLIGDLALLFHILDENNPIALKKRLERYKDVFGIPNTHALAATEKKELDTSIIENGGKPGMVWRADLGFQSKYACADTFYTYGMWNAALEEFIADFGERGLKWFFEQEVMPVCKEVVIDMKRRGVYVDVPYFEKLYKENEIKMNQLEDELIGLMESNGWLKNFELGKSMDEAVSNQRFIKKVIELENLEIPKKYDKKSDTWKETLAEGEIKKTYQKDPHWLWGYILGEDELKYSDEKIAEIKQALYEEVTNGKRYRFNIGSRDHLVWLFCDTLGMSKTKLPQTDSATKDNPIPSIDADVLKEYVLPNHPWVSKLLTYRKLQKMQSAYIKPAIVLSIDGWLYMDMKQNGTTSGRFSCSGGYNLQTLPRVDDELEILEACDKCHSSNVTITEDLTCIADRICNDCGHVEKDIPRPSAIKQGFIAPPGYKIINADYSSLEPRCFAVESGEDAIKEVYWKGLDLYSKVYCDIFDEKGEFSADPNDANFLKKAAKSKRTWVKPIVLGIPYGAEDDQVANLIGAKKQKTDFKDNLVFDEDGEPVMVADHTEGKRVRDAYLKRYPNLKKFMNEQNEKAVMLGYVETRIGRKRHLPFAKKINDVLTKYGINWKDLLYAPIWELQKGLNVSYTSFRRVKVNLSQEMMDEIQESINFKTESMITKGYWKYVRAMLRADLNNAKNNPIQGLAGHITNLGMRDTNRLIRQKGLDAWVCLQVHDEITGYARIDQADQAAECLQVGMEKNEFTQLLDIDMIADPIVCDNLKESK